MTQEIEAKEIEAKEKGDEQALFRKNKIVIEAAFFYIGFILLSLMIAGIMSREINNLVLCLLFVSCTGAILAVVMRVYILLEKLYKKME